MSMNRPGRPPTRWAPPPGVPAGVAYPGTQPAPVPPPRRQAGRTPFLAPLIALVGIAVIGAGSAWGINTLGLGLEDDADPGTAAASLAPGETLDPRASEDPGVETPTPGPSVVITPPPDERPTVKGTILFTAGGNISALSGQELRQLSRKGADSTPVWSPDGKRIYFVETKARTGEAIGSVGGGKYTLYYPNIMVMRPDGKKRKAVFESLIRRGREAWFSWVLQPDPNPNGRTLAVVSDGPDGLGPVTLHSLPVKRGRPTDMRIRARGELGHNDPAWSPNGKELAFTLNARDGQTGAPVIGIYTVRNGKLRYSKKPGEGGYANPSWSPDGTWLAAERTTGNGRDIVILSADRGDELARLTSDGSSFSPVVSPDGDQIVYIHRDGLEMDLRLMTLAFPNGRPTLVADQPLTDDGRIDAESPPAWFIPKDERKPPPGVATPSAAPEASDEVEAEAAP